MISKSQLLEFAINKFITFGSRSFTMDELAKELGMSKKTIYSCFKNKEELVSESLSFFIERIKQEMEETIAKETDPLLKIILIYQIGFNYFEHFKPSFIFSIKKYYPKADAVFESFRDDIVNHKVRNLLLEAQYTGIFRKEIDIDLVCELYFLRVENVVYKRNNLFDTYSKESLLQHLVVNNLRGLTVSGYSNFYFE